MFFRILGFLLVGALSLETNAVLAQTLTNLPAEYDPGENFSYMKGGLFVFGKGPKGWIKPIRLSPFWMQRTEITQEMFVEVTGYNTSQDRFNYEYRCPKTYRTINGVKLCPEYPVDGVTSDDVKFFLERLNMSPAAEHFLYRLPTEAEWEYAAKDGKPLEDSMIVPGKKLEEFAWVASNSNSRLHPVASLEPTPNGLYDMVGNVAEIVWDSGHPHKDWDQIFSTLAANEVEVVDPLFVIKRLKGRCSMGQAYCFPARDESPIYGEHVVKGGDVKITEPNIFDWFENTDMHSVLGFRIVAVQKRSEDTKENQ